MPKIIIKQKSLIVAMVSSFVILLVLVFTLLGYLIYIELSGEDFKRTYEEMLRKVNARVYSGNIDIQRLTAKIEKTGPLKGKPIIEGELKNKGPKEISDILIKVKFLDKDGAIIYETVFHPQEPSLGTSGLGSVSIPYFSGSSRLTLKTGGSFPFKRVLNNCPGEIMETLQDTSGYAKGAPRWSGKLTFEVSAIAF
ncbi:MAG: hypothetical protein PHP46_00445 [Candidatus Omnitrophica bacterium]|nr:hypothetical protein [Candidatus Omnitrophota bacterium]